LNEYHQMIGSEVNINCCF